MNTFRVVVSLHQPLRHSFTPGLSSLCGVLQLSFGTRVCLFGFVCAFLQYFGGHAHQVHNFGTYSERQPGTSCRKARAFTTYISQRVFACGFWTPTGRSEKGLANGDNCVQIVRGLAPESNSTVTGDEYVRCCIVRVWYVGTVAGCEAPEG